MPQTYKDYSSVEVAVSLTSEKDLASGHERKQEGDIIVVRRPLKGIGTAEAKTHLWLKVEGLDKADLDKLTQQVDEDNDYGKRRYCIPLEQIKKQMSSFDISRALDKDEIYQPFLLVDEDNYLFLVEVAPLQVQGLVFDKNKGTYI